MKPRYKGAVSRSAPEAFNTSNVDTLEQVWQYDDEMGIRPNPMTENIDARVPELERAPESQRGDT